MNHVEAVEKALVEQVIDDAIEERNRRGGHDPEPARGPVALDFLQPPGQPHLVARAERVDFLKQEDAGARDVAPGHALRRPLAKNPQRPALPAIDNLNRSFG